MYKNTTFWKEYIICLKKYKAIELNPETPGEWIKFHRIQMGWSQMELAIKLELTSHQGRYLIKDYETRGLYPPQELSFKLARLFELDTKYFYDTYYEFLDKNPSKIVKDYRINNKLTKTKLAELLGTTYEAITRWEKGYSISRKYYKKIKELIQLTT